MSYEKFKANVMAAKIMEDRTRASAFINHTVREYEGLLRNVGDSVTIKGAGKVAFTHTSDGKPIKLGDPQTPEGTNAILTVKQQDAFNFMVPDIDAAQGAKDSIALYRRQVSNELAMIQDRYIASMAQSPLAKLASANATQATKANILEMLDDAVQWLQEGDVPTTEKVTAFVTPAAFKLIRQNDIALDTDNSNMLASGAVAKYNNLDIVISNNVVRNNGVDYCMIMTDKAIAFVDAITKIEAKRANDYIADEVRGVSLYDAKLIRPKELYVLNIKYTA
jgi:hypothetical protein